MEQAEKLVHAFGVGFILKKNLNVIATAGYEETWVSFVRALYGRWRLFVVSNTSLLLSLDRRLMSSTLE